MDRERWMTWLAGYERAWRAVGTDALAELFTPEASYRTAPFEPAFEGLPAIRAMWEDGRRGADERFDLEVEPVAIEPPTGVIRAEVHYGEPHGRTYRNLWIVSLAEDGRCSSFEEWPFWPPGSGGGYAAGPQFP